ncbi:exocyst complex component EXO70C1-like [Cornus florida]|uniref:exocyst complex component EXO70C1-like n=1 Tax=Cornus florida TaxID=4283 RepID=UPI00289E05F0|nr:exocyst complex component EXO70C1-like [Cornus florida]
MWFGKDKGFLHKSDGGEDKDKDKDKNKNNQQQHHDDHGDHQKQESDNVSGDQPAEIEEKSSYTETDIKVDVEEVEEEPIIKTNDEDPSPSPPDFDKVSKEIDEFISHLSTAQGEESEPPEPEVPEFVDQFAFFVEAKIANYDSIDCPMKWTQVPEEDSSLFLEAVDRVCKLTTSLSQFSSHSNYAPLINRIGGILDRAMSYLEDEFRSLLEHYSLNSSANNDSDHNNINESKPKQSSNESDNSSTMPESDSTEETHFPGYSEAVVSNMKRLAKALVSGGYETECCEVYIVARRNLFEESLRNLGFEKHSFEDVQKMQWESLEKTIVSWINTFKQCTAAYFPGERKLSEAVFSDHASISERLFSILSGCVMIELVNFAEAVAMSKRLAEKLFKFLDMYETLRDVIPIMDTLFPNECIRDLKSEALLTRIRFGQTIVSIFLELEKSIKADAGKTPVPGGAVHPLTRYTMNYLKYACEYKDTLEQVFREIQKIEQADPDSTATGLDFLFCDHNNNKDKVQGHDDGSSDQTSENESMFATLVMKVMDLLYTNLEGKSKLYRDTALSLIFLMNNGRYIMQKIKSAEEINGLIGAMWSRKRSSDLRQYHKNYQRETWGKLLQCLTLEGLIVKGKVQKPVLKERFKSFNALFDEIHKTQSTWVVSDEQLQSELRVSISAVVIPAYRSFLARFSQNFTPGRQTEKYIKYQSEDIETHIEGLFEGGNAAPSMWRRRP